MVHVQQDFFQQILNGFANEKQKVDASSSAIIIPSVQQTYFRKKTLPLILAADEKQGLLRQYFQHYYQKFLKQKKRRTLGLGLGISLLFVRAIDDQQVQREEEKGGVLKKLITVGKTYQRVKRVMRAIETIKDLKQSLQQKIKASNVSGNNEYLQAGLYRVLGESQDQLQEALQSVMFPIYLQFSKMIHTKANSILNRFFFYIVQRIFLPDLTDPLDTIMWFASLGLTILSVPSGGLSLSGVGAVVATRLSGIISKLAMTSARISLKMSMVSFKIAGRMAMRAAVAGGKMAWRGARFVIRGGSDNVASTMRTYYKRLNLAAMAYTGIDLFFTDKRDVERMTQYYTNQTTQWGDKVTKSLTGRLMAIGQDMEMIERHFRQIGQDAYDSFVTSISSSGVLKILSRKYKTSIRLKIVGENNNLLKVFKTLENVQKYFKTGLENVENKIGDVFITVGRSIKNNSSQVFRTIMSSIIVEEGNTKTFMGRDGTTFKESFKKSINGEEITFERNGEKITGKPIHTMKADQTYLRQNRRRDLTYDESSFVNNIKFLTTSRAISGLEISINGISYNVSKVQKVFQNGKQITRSGDLPYGILMKGKKFFIGNGGQIFVDFTDMYQYKNGSAKTNKYDADHNRIGSINDKVSANGLFIWDFFLHQRYEENTLLKAEKQYTKNASKLKQTFVEGTRINQNG